MKQVKAKQIARRKLGVRGKMQHLTVPRLVVHRTNKHIYAQIIDPTGKVVASASDVKLKDAKSVKIDKATKVGTELAEHAKKAKVTKVVFDRGSFRYHGRIKALAQGARDGGLQF